MHARIRGVARRTNSGKSIAGQRVGLLRSAARRAAGIQWTPALFHQLLEELYVDEDYFALIGGPNIPPARYAEALALALLSRHSWQVDDFVDVAARLGLTHLSVEPAVRPAQHVRRHSWRRG